MVIFQVCMYLRWLQWQLHRERSEKDCLVINMDETNVSNLTSWKHGWALHRRPMKCDSKRARPKPARELDEPYGKCVQQRGVADNIASGDASETSWKNTAF